jgi:hypothetical protein
MSTSVIDSNKFLKLLHIDYFYKELEILKNADKNLTEFKKAYEFSRSIATISLDENYLKNNTAIFFLDHFKIEPKNLKFYSLHEIINKIETVTSEIFINNFLPYLIPILIEFRKWYLLEKIALKNPNINIDYKLDHTVRLQREKRLLGKNSSEIEKGFEDILSINQDLFGKKPHKNGYASEVKEGIKKYKKVTLKSLYNTLEKINPGQSKRQQKILLYNIINAINIYPYYIQKTEDDIAKFHSEDEFKYRKINSLLR